MTPPEAAAGDPIEEATRADRIGEAAERLHRLADLPFRLVLEAGDAGERVVHDSLGEASAPGELSRRVLPGPGEGRARLVWRTSPARDRTGRLLADVLERMLRAEAEARGLVQESLRRERLAVELGLAHDLQLKLLPDPDAVSDLTPVAARSEPAESVGGDFYHLIRLSGGRLGVMVGDVSSHGVSAALVMAQAMSAAGIVAQEEEGPGAVLGRIGRELRRELDSTDMYVTLFYAVVEPGADALRYASAGHPHAYLLGRSGARRLEPLDRPIGVAGEGPLHERAVGTRGRELLFLFTDGLFEPAEGRWRSAEARVADVAAAAAGEGAGAAVGAAFEASDRERRVERDDRTAVAVEL